MKVAIIGSGNVGKALGTSLTRAGHEVTLTANDPQHATEAAAQIGASSNGSNVDAMRDADFVILAAPYAVVRDQVAPEILDAARGHVVIDATNPLTADYSGLATGDTSAAEQFQQLLPGSHVIKAFNTVFASVQADPSAGEGTVDGYVAGDDATAKQAVLELVASIGLTPLDVGPLSSARYLEGMAFMNIGLNAANGWGWNTIWRLER